MSDAKPRCIVYCRSWCLDCRIALRWMREMGYEFEEIDIEQDSAAAERVVQLAGKVVTPTFEIGEKCIVGFDEDAVFEALR
jgi:glutaredoxin